MLLWASNALFIIFYDLYLLFVLVLYPFFHTFDLMIPYSHFCNITLGSTENTSEIWVIY